jgi:WD40 repeat protein
VLTLLADHTCNGLVPTLSGFAMLGIFQQMAWVSHLQTAVDPPVCLSASVQQPQAPWIRSWLLLTCALLLAAPGCAGTTAAGTAESSLDASAAGTCKIPTTITDFPIAGAIGNKWNAVTQTLAYGRARADGHYATYLSDVDGRNSRRLTYTGWRDDRHQFPVAWYPDGRYLVMSVEKAQHPGSSVSATPGYGGYTDYWLITRDGSKAWKLVDLPDDGDHAITHAAFSPDGTKFVWTERIKAPDIFDLNRFAGYYEFNLATFVDGPVPHLIDIHSFIPGGGDQGGEVESLAADDKTIAFYSTYVTHNLFASRIYTLDTDSGAIHELTNQSWAQAPTFTPDGKHIVYITGQDADIFPWSLQGADWWIMDLDGTHKRRLTYMNVRNGPQSVNQFRLAGSLSFISDYVFLGDVMTRSFGLVGKIVRVTIKPDCI